MIEKEVRKYISRDMDGDMFLISVIRERARDNNDNNYNNNNHKLASFITLFIAI